MSEKKEIKIRPMVEDDLAKVNAIDQSITGQGRVTTWPFSFEAYWRVYSKEALVFVAELNGEVVGFISGYIEHAKRSTSMLEHPHEAVHRTDETVGWIEMMGIRPDCWHMGIGGRLVAAFEQACKKQNAKMRIVVREGDRDLTAFLERAGFKKSELTTYEKAV